MGVSNHLNRPWTKRAAAVAAITGAAFYGIAAGGIAHANSAPAMTITGVSPHHVAAGVKNQVIAVTGTNFDEDSISGISIDACPSGDPMYIVTSPTTLVLKTSGTNCVAKPDAVIDIAVVGGGDVKTVVKTVKTELDFVTAPTIAKADATHRPMSTEYTQGVTYASQVHSASVAGGSVVRILAGDKTTNPFATSASYPLAASLGGVPMTGIKVASDGSYFTAVLGAASAEDPKPALKITNNGVTASFPYNATPTDQTHDFTYAGNTISVSPAFGGIAGGDTITVSGSGFTSATTVDFGGTACDVVGTITGTVTKLTCKTKAATTAGPVAVTVKTGTLQNVVSAGSTFTYLDA